MTWATYADHFYTLSRLQSVYLPAAPHTDNLFSYLSNTQSPVSHVAGAKKTNINLHPGHHSSVNLLRSPSGIIVMSNKTKLTIRKKSVKVIFFFFRIAGTCLWWWKRYILIVTHCFFSLIKVFTFTIQWLTSWLNHMS